MDNQLEQARLRLELEEIEGLLEERKLQRRQRNLEACLARQELLGRVQSARLERERRRHELELEMGQRQLEQRMMLLRCQSDLFLAQVQALRSA
ncbi:hypothetical protein DYH09_28045 [bacterium CPR1]|jgi:hypothetical protein|nr:hypothetical protein [bacterium CPR1]